MSNVYVRLSSSTVVKESRELVEGVVIADYGSNGELIGVEVLGSISVKIDGKPAVKLVKLPPATPLPFPEEDDE